MGYLWNTSYSLELVAVTKKRITDLILNLVERFGRTDDSRKDETVIGNFVDNLRAQYIVADFEKNGKIDRAWLTDLGVQTTHRVNFPDDPNINYACGNVSKLIIPSVISLKSHDLGIVSLLSPGGDTEYYPLPLSFWKMIEDNEVKKKFSYYDRINTALYLKGANNQFVEKVRPIVILESPEEGYIINSTPVSSGSIASGTVYKVKYGTVVYRGVAYKADETFTGGATTTFTGNGKVYLNSQLSSIAETSAYPLGMDMIRRLIVDICVTEFKIEMAQVADVVNNSVDDSAQ